MRITTHYLEDNFASSMYSVIHEGGHALYDTHPMDKLAHTVLGGGVSMGIHEGQSRFFENIIGRSRSFIRLIAPQAARALPGDGRLRRRGALPRVQPRRAFADPHRGG